VFIVFLKFGAKRSEAVKWMAQHNLWLQRNCDAQVILLAGSLDEGQGGALIVAGVNSDALQAMLADDPFVREEIVVPEVHSVSPSKLAAGMPAILSPGATGRLPG